jgi:hypothetical protein
MTTANPCPVRLLRGNPAGGDPQDEGHQAIQNRFRYWGRLEPRGTWIKAILYKPCGSPENN